MKVNNEDVTSSDIRRIWESLLPPGQAPAFDTLKPEMQEAHPARHHDRALLYQEALKQGVDKSDTVQQQLEEAKHKIVVKTFLEAKTADISDKDLHDAYDQLVTSMRDQKEVRARHILVASEKDAQDAKKKIESGKSFEEVAKEYSKDPGSAQQGGDLGYFTKDKMVKEFADAAFSMKKGEVSGPVKSPFGWHIIKVEDIRPVTVPTYNDAKDKIREQLEEKKLGDYVRTLVKSADVEAVRRQGQGDPLQQGNPRR